MIRESGSRIDLIVGCYSIDLCCKNHPNSRGRGCLDPKAWSIDLHMKNFTGRDSKESFKTARRAGWKFTNDGDVICPYCAKTTKTG